MAREMLINVSEGEECRIALMEDGRLEELYMERSSSTSHVGNIYKGRVTNVEPSIQAAFVDFGLGRNGFLHISDLMPTYFGRRGEDVQEAVGRKMARRDRPPIQRCLRRGDEIIVQIIKEGIGTKGPTLTTYLSIPGRILVMMPGMVSKGVSRKIEDETERRRLRKILDELKPPKDCGFILRTAGVGKSGAEIERDLNYLTRLWENIDEKMKEPAPVELYTEGDLVTRTVRDAFAGDLDRIIVDSPDVARRIQDFVKISSPRAKNRVELYDEPIPLFHKYGIEREIELMYSRHVPLPSGGSLVIDSTEAIVAIDVNSGKFRDHSDAETTAFKTDMEAADEIARQLKLRDLGGVIICDFIDLRFERHRRALEERLHNNLKIDRAKTKVLRMSQFGIIEMTRQRMRPSLKRSVYFDCPHCHGSGLVKTPESMSLDVMRRLAIAANDQRVVKINLAVCSEVAFYLLNRKRDLLAELERQTGKDITVRSDPALALDDTKLELYDTRDGLVFIEALGMKPADALPAHGHHRAGGHRAQAPRQGGGRRDGRGGGERRDHAARQPQQPQQPVRRGARDEDHEEPEDRYELESMDDRGGDDRETESEAVVADNRGGGSRGDNRGPRNDDRRSRNDQAPRNVVDDRDHEDHGDHEEHEEQEEHDEHDEDSVGNRFDRAGSSNGEPAAARSRQPQPQNRPQHGQGHGQSRGQGQQHAQGRGQGPGQGQQRGQGQGQHRQGQGQGQGRGQGQGQGQGGQPRGQGQQPSAQVQGQAQGQSRGPGQQAPVPAQGQGEGQEGGGRRRRRRRGGRGRGRGGQGGQNAPQIPGQERDEEQFSNAGFPEATGPADVAPQDTARDHDEDFEDREDRGELFATPVANEPGHFEVLEGPEEIRDDDAPAEAVEESTDAPVAESRPSRSSRGRRDIDDLDEDRFERPEVTEAVAETDDVTAATAETAQATEASEAAEAEPTAAGEDESGKKPGRRRRGGRGRGGRGRKSDAAAPADEGTEAAPAEAEAEAPAEPAKPAKAAKPTRAAKATKPAPRSRRSSAKDKDAAKSGAASSAAAEPAPQPAVVRTGSTDRHLMQDEPVMPEPPRRPRTYRDLDAIPDDLD